MAARSVHAEVPVRAREQALQQQLATLQLHTVQQILYVSGVKAPDGVGMPLELHHCLPSAHIYQVRRPLQV